MDRHTTGPSPDCAAAAGTAGYAWATAASDQMAGDTSGSDQADVARSLSTNQPVTHRSHKDRSGGVGDRRSWWLGRYPRSHPSSPISLMLAARTFIQGVSRASRVACMLHGPPFAPSDCKMINYDLFVRSCEQRCCGAQERGLSGILSQPTKAGLSGLAIFLSTQATGQPESPVFMGWARACSVAMRADAAAIRVRRVRRSGIGAPAPPTETCLERVRLGNGPPVPNPVCQAPHSPKHPH